MIFFYTIAIIILVLYGKAGDIRMPDISNHEPTRRSYNPPRAKQRKGFCKSDAVEKFYKKEENESKPLTHTEYLRQQNELNKLKLLYYLR